MHVCTYVCTHVSMRFKDSQSLMVHEKGEHTIQYACMYVRMHTCEYEIQGFTVSPTALARNLIPLIFFTSDRFPNLLLSTGATDTFASTRKDPSGNGYMYVQEYYVHMYVHTWTTYYMYRNNIYMYFTGWNLYTKDTGVGGTCTQRNTGVGGTCTQRTQVWVEPVHKGHGCGWNLYTKNTGVGGTCTQRARVWVEPVHKEHRCGWNLYTKGTGVGGTCTQRTQDTSHPPCCHHKS